MERRLREMEESTLKSPEQNALSKLYRPVEGARQDSDEGSK